MNDTSTLVAADSRVVAWQIEPEGFLSRHWELYQDDELITTLRMGYWNEGCEFTVAGQKFAVSRKSFWKDGFFLTHGDDVVCDVKRNFFSRKFFLVAGEQWVLQPAGWFTREYQLFAGEQPVGCIRPAGWFTRKKAAEFSRDVPLPLQVLAVYLYVAVSKRQQLKSSD
jgi:hypothetical protein